VGTCIDAVICLVAASTNSSSFAYVSLAVVLGIFVFTCWSAPPSRTYSKAKSVPDYRAREGVGTRGGSQ
jgi:hypothetical protein